MAEEATRDQVIGVHTAKVIELIKQAIDDGLRGVEVTLYHHEAYPTVIQNVYHSEELPSTLRWQIVGRSITNTEEGPLVQVAVMFCW